MGFQTDNARIRKKIERLARLTGKDEDSALEDALDAQLSVRAHSEPSFDTVSPEVKERRLRRARQVLAEVDKDILLPPEKQFEAVEWDDLGLPK